jgi:hypothetical protein
LAISRAFVQSSAVIWLAPYFSAMVIAEAINRFAGEFDPQPWRLDETNSVLRRTVWLGMSDSNRRIRPRAI